jgi:hypothetical protein
MKRERIILIFALVSGLIIAWIDTRPHWDDTGVTIGLLLLTSTICGAWSRSLSWLWGLIIGGIVFTANAAMSGNYESIVAVIVAIVGAYIGTGARIFFGIKLKSK